MNLIFIFVSVIFCSLFSFAGGGSGGDVSGGGNGVMVGNEIHLLDLVESGYRSSSLQSTSVPLAVDLGMADLMGARAELILRQKVTRIWQEDRILAAAILQAVSFYQWALVERKLIGIPVTGSPLDVSVIQLAARQPQAIYVDKEAFQKMPADHRAALVLHEVLGALAPEDLPLIRVRQLVGSLFSEDPLSQAIKRSIQDYWPSRSQVEKAVGDVVGNFRKQVVVLELGPVVGPMREDGRSPIQSLEGFYQMPLINPTIETSRVTASLEALLRIENFERADSLESNCGFFDPKQGTLFFQIYAYRINLSARPLGEKNLPFLSVEYKKQLWYTSFVRPGESCQVLRADKLSLDRMLESIWIF